MRTESTRELLGWSVALGVSLVAAAQVAASPRSELLFRDGDSLIVAMLSRSLLAGEPLDWAMSSVLFLPEIAVFTGISAVLPIGVNGVLAVNAVVNLLGVYGAVRLAAGRRGAGRAPVAWSVLAVGVFGLLAIAELSPSRDALELASLQLTTTYYSATVVAVMLVIGLARRRLDGSGPWPVAGIALIATAATTSNPLFAVWATVPLTAVLLVGASRTTRRGRMLIPAAALLGGTALGFLARIPFSAWITNTGAGYAQPGQWAQSVDYYTGLLVERMSSAAGMIGTLLTVALIVHAVVRTLRAGSAGERLVAAAGWVLPLLVVVGAIALGTHAARYLQPVAFAPVLALVARPVTVRMPRLLAAVAVVVAALAGALSIPRLVASAQTPDADLDCVTAWIGASGQTGAGQFWTVRLPKAHLHDPARLVQVDHHLNGYAWLVNRTDFAEERVSFLIEDAQSLQWELPVAVVPDEIVQCGRYTILDFAPGALPLGPAHS